MGNKFLKTFAVGVFALTIFPSQALDNRVFTPNFDNTIDLRQNFVSDEIIVKFKNENTAEIQKISARYNILAIKKRLLGANAVKLPANADIFEKIRELQANPNVEYAEPNYTAYALAVPNDPYFSHQWSFGSNSLDMAKVWDIATGKGAIVAVVDTGIAYESYKKFKIAPDLAQTKFVPGYNTIVNSSHANDDNGHGTHVTGTIAQSTNNGFGTAGIAYNASIMPVKVLDKSGAGSYADIADGIIWAAQNGANIINLSLGGPYPSETLRQALAFARSKGVFIVAASGNDGANSVSYPAAYDQYVMAVGATRYDKAVTNYSNRGSALDVVAPGGDTKVDQDSNNYGDGILQQTFSGNPSNFGFYFFQGTSMASPHAAATAALLYEKGVKDPNQIQQILQSTANDLGPTGWDQTNGHGLINPLKALTSISQPIIQSQSSPSPQPQISSSPEPSATPKPAKTVHVADISLYLRNTFLRSRATADIIIHDEQNSPVVGAQVEGVWSGVTSETATGQTDSDGKATFSSRSVWRAPGEFVFEIKSVKINGYEYDPTQNSTTIEKIQIANIRNLSNFKKLEE